MHFEYERVSTWPPLAWLARCPVSGESVAGESVHVRHGARVETRADWFCEAVWDGTYEQGAFDRTDLVFGSGGRLREGALRFVSAGSTLDRLHSARAGGHVHVSNSLPCLLQALGAHVDPTYARYFEDFETIIHGLRRYKRTLATSAGPLRLTYFDNLRWNGQRLIEEEKPASERDFSSFRTYRHFLESSLRRLAENMAASERSHPYEMLGTLSSGYDSPTIVALARPAGLREALSFRQARGDKDDSGSGIAGALGVHVLSAERDAWESMEMAEVPFIAADAKGEDAYFSGVKSRLAGRVLLTGFHGDKVWGKETKALGADVVRGDQSGLSLTEYRLRAGFIHCPVPFMGVRRIREIHAISNAPELAPWDVPGSYSRPICRRIVEEAGVPREQFGVEKKAASVLFFESDHFLTPGARAEYVRWLEARAGTWARKGHVPPHLASRMLHVPKALARLAAERLYEAAEAVPRKVFPFRPVARRLAQFGQREYLFRFVFPWAVERAKERYAEPPATSI